MKANDTTIVVVVESVRHRKEDSGWAILQTDRGVCKGVVAWEPRAGERLRLVGGWELSKFSGKDEFSFRSAMLDLDLDPRALLHYAVTQTNGIGEAKEDAIWQVYGAGWQDDPELVLIDGLTLAARENWQDTLKALADLTAQMQAMTWLLAHGCTDKLAASAWGAWREETVGIVSHDPYRLADLHGRGFAEIDSKVARPYFGIGERDPRRVDAAVLYVLRSGDGDTLQPVDLVAGGLAAAGVSPDLLGEGLTRLSAGDEPKAVMFPGEPGRRDEVALTEDYKAETAIWQRFGKGVAA